MKVKFVEGFEILGAPVSEFEGSATEFMLLVTLEPLEPKVPVTAVKEKEYYVEVKDGFTSDGAILTYKLIGFPKDLAERHGRAMLRRTCRGSLELYKIDGKRIPSSETKSYNYFLGRDYGSHGNFEISDFNYTITLLGK